MKKTALAAALAASAIFANGAGTPGGFERNADPATGGTIVDGIAARVDSATITIGDVMNEIRNNPRLRAGVNLADKIEFERLYRKTVEALVERKLVLKAADEAKLELQDWAVDSRVREIVRDHFDGNVDNLHAALAESRTAYSDWRRGVKEEMIVSAMRYQKIEKNVDAAPGAMRAEYKDHPERYSEQPRATVSVILLAPAEGKPEPAKRAEALLAELAKGADFAKLAKENSSDTHAAEGGLWKDIDPKEYFLPEIVKHLATLKSGQTSPKPVTFGGYAVIVRKESESPGRLKSFAECYGEIERNVCAKEREKLYTEWIGNLRERSSIRMYDIPKDRPRLKN